jgi:hypothetical protein
MDVTQSKLGAMYKERDAAVATATPTIIIDRVAPLKSAEGLSILFSMDNVVAWANGQLQIFNNGVLVWTYDDQFMTLLESHFLYRPVRLGDNYSAVLTHTFGVDVEAAIQISMDYAPRLVHE